MVEGCIYGGGVGEGVAFRAFNSYRNRFAFSSRMLDVTNVFVYMLPYMLPTCYHTCYQL